MKNVILSLALLTGFCSSQVFASQNKDDDKKKTELNKFKEDCTKGMVDMGQDAEVAKNLCNCITTKVDELFTAEEVTSFNEGNIEGLPLEKLEKFQQVVQDCATQK